MKPKAKLWLVTLAATLLSLCISVASADVNSDEEEDLCCIMPDEWNYECRCNVGWVCDREKVTAGFCGSSKCFSNCKITNWALGAIIAAAGVLIIIFALVIILFCRKKKDDDDDIY